MDALSALLPTNPVPLALTVNGRPLNDVLTVIANALRSQQDEIRDFKQLHQQHMKEVAQKLTELDGRIRTIEVDLQISRRPFAAYGQPPMGTAYDAITTMEYRLHRSSCAVRTNINQDIAAFYTKAVLQRYWAKLSKYVTLRTAVRNMSGASRLLTLGGMYRRWQAGVALIKQRRSRARNVSAIIYTNGKLLTATYLRKWLEWHKDLHARLHEKRARDAKVSDALATFNLRGVVRRYFNKWAQYQEHLAYNAHRYRQAQHLEVVAHRTVALNAYERWQEFTNYRLFEVRRQRAINTRHKQALRALVLRYLTKWQRFVSVQQARQAKYVLVARMHHSATMRLARRYFDKILRFVTFTQQRRRSDELAAYLTLLAKKYDAMGEQMDLSLDNLTHTNGVLSRVVDTIILTNPDAPQVQSLLQVHRGDRLINNRLTSKYDVEEQLGLPPTSARGVSEARRREVASAAEGINNSALSANAAAAVAAPLPTRHQDFVATSSSRATLPSVHNRRHRMLSPGLSRENPEHRVLNVRDLIADHSPQGRK